MLEVGQPDQDRADEGAQDLGRRLQPQRPGHQRRRVGDLTGGGVAEDQDLLRHYEGVKLVFKEDAVDTLAAYAFDVNQTAQNIGARRLYTILERVLEELSFEAPDNTTIIVRDIDKQAVGQVAAEIRSKRPPEPYKGKGVRYTTEWVRTKAGKQGATA